MFCGTFILFYINKSSSIFRYFFFKFFLIYCFILGKIIPASQRPDGTWRKARRVKDGYVPQEEVPLYESKGKQFANKSSSSLPVGMCPIIAEKNRLKREKGEKKQNSKNIVPGLINLSSITGASATAAGVSNSAGSGKKKVGKRKLGDKQTTNSSAAIASSSQITSQSLITTKHSTKIIIDESIKELTLDNNNVDGEDSIEKKLKKLRKKIREIELIEEKLITRELKNPDQDQLDKVSRKIKIQQEIKKLERSAAAVFKTDETN